MRTLGEQLACRLTASRCDVPRCLRGVAGPAKAITAGTHKLAGLLYAMLKNGTYCVHMVNEECERGYRE